MLCSLKKNGEIRNLQSAIEALRDELEVIRGRADSAEASERSKWAAENGTLKKAIGVLRDELDSVEETHKFDQRALEQKNREEVKVYQDMVAALRAELEKAHGNAK